MIRINLLPHRELKRKALQQQFAVLAGLTVGLGVLIIWGVHEMVMDKINHQNGRNQYLRDEIAVLDRQITEIKSIKEKIQEMLARKEIVESLQGNRIKVVHMLDEVARQLPEGVYLKSLKQTNEHLHLAGYAQSNAGISTLMRHLDASPWLESPLLIEIKAATESGVRLSEFDLNVKLTELPEEDGHSGRNEMAAKITATAGQP
ncbi:MULTISPECIES: PilN domain-containing protein [Nitrosomonas]|uniref:Type IV pilus assembly protein PilN n=2 Tax=Nitrosomonas eutropha TaxID=916 RepID=A0ABX5M770_9PROT|nr:MULTISPECIES: PilN domain-containing protein [Nitrosomonas]ABI60040.1 Fimbrial assembly family protein [Nitrosomonas eutropha C91]MXS79208.1 fimbrial protein [Nitrosomonas sp. GH22]PXV74332.1 type IV pilus assembly protein PilN [Nitrosomonas eutropha]SCX28212.1 type IV pilus assembly protein PilN [Nitrosomonas eutropha]SEJ30248.1 type IV pilus assembly protein PilN [Nitrosomonas eutropha]